MYILLWEMGAKIFKTSLSLAKVYLQMRIMLYMFGGAVNN